MSNLQTELKRLLIKLKLREPYKELRKYSYCRYFKNYEEFNTMRSIIESEVASTTQAEFCKTFIEEYGVFRTGGHFAKFTVTVYGHNI